MRYLLEDLMELAVCQARHDWKQFKGAIRWCNDHCMQLSICFMGLPLLALIVIEVVCWVMLRQQSAQLAELRQMIR